MKQITPMSRLKDHFKKFNNIVDSITESYNLSKNKPKYTYGETYSKGVETENSP